MSRGVIINNEGALESVLNITTIRALDGDTAYIGEVWISNLSDDDIDAIKTAIEAYSPGGGGGDRYAEGVADGKAAIATSQKLDIANYQVKLRNYDQDIADADIDTNEGQLDVISESYQFIKTPDEITQIQNTAYNNGANEARHLIAIDHQPIAEEYKSILSNVPAIQEQDPTNLIGQRNIFSLSADYLGGGATGTPFSYADIVQVYTMSRPPIWTDGENIYYSSGGSQYVLDRETSIWGDQTWAGLTYPAGLYIWSDGEKIYYSGGSASNQYVLNKETSTWTKKTWGGLTSFYGSNVWTDGDNIYYSSSSSQYVLDKETSTWSVKTWTDLTSFNGQYVWTDGDNIYYGGGSSQYVLDKETSTWSVKTWTGLTSISGQYVWSDGDNIYYSTGSTQYVLDKETSTWTKKTWTGLTSFDGDGIWTVDNNIYYSTVGSATSTQYVLDKTTSTWTKKTFYYNFRGTIYIAKNNTIYNIKTDVDMSFIPK